MLNFQGVRTVEALQKENAKSRYKLVDLRLYLIEKE